MKPLDEFLPEETHHPEPGLAPTPMPRRTHRTHVLNTIAATLIVGAIIGVSLVLFSRHDAPSQVTTLDSQGKHITVTSSAGGFVMVMRLTAGPYFLSEMLEVDISLSNHIDTAAHLGFPFERDACGYHSSYNTGVQIVGGNKPVYTLPMPTDHSCPAPFGNGIVLKPGQTLSVTRYLPLTLSGQMTLIGKTQFYQPGASDFPEPATSPLDNHWPSLHITVSPQIPADRTLSLQRTNTQVTVLAPPGQQLVYMYTITCTNTFGGNFGWEPISTITIKPFDDYCRRVQMAWSFAFAVPGYAILTGSGKFQAP